MALAPGYRLGPYEIRDAVDAGGMGEVYRARDTRLDRTVAIKVIAPHRVADANSRERFQREARAVAALNHPHICHLNDVGHHDGVDFLVMEFLDGETLAARLARGRPALDEVLRHAIEIAEALAEAHAHAIVHRDLKPANVMVTRTGVKLLDFGLAKMRPVAGGAGASLSTLGPTREAPLTDEGSLLGTWPYMAPEQLEGKEADARTDIFAFGAVLYEMATGVRAFDGESHASLIAAILKQDPPAFAAREVVAPAALERVVRKCLAKLPDARWQSARDLADALKWVAEERQLSTQRLDAAPSALPSRSMRWPWVVAVAAAAALGVTAALNLPRTDPPGPIRRYMIQPTDEARILVPQPRFVLTPDGRALVYTADAGKGSSLFVQSLDQRVPRQIPGTANASELATSPDGGWVAFTTGSGALKKASLTSGAPPVTLAEGLHALDQSIAWLANDSIIIGVQPDYRGGGLFRISANGGALSRLTTPVTAEGELDHHMPRPVPGGKVLLFARHLKKGDVESFDTAIVHLDTGAVTPLLPEAFDARIAPTGHLLFARGSSLLAAPFDADQRSLTAPPVVMVDEIMSENSVGGTGAFGWSARYAVADDGTLVYIPPVVRTGRRLAWVSSSEAPEALAVEPREFSRPTLSPDGRRVAVQVEREGRRDIWIYDLLQDIFTPLTSNGSSVAPVWTRDGQRVTFSVVRNGREQIYWQGIDGSAAELLIAEAGFRLFPGSWDGENRTLVFVRNPPDDIVRLGLFDVATRRATEVGGEPGSLTQPQISPDGRWLAFTQTENGRPQVFVRALTGGALRRQISTEGGYAALWGRDGKTLYYRGITGVNGVGDFMAVDVGRLPAVGRSKQVARGLSAVRGGMHHTGYDVASDGRLLIVQPGEEESAPLRFEIVLNWFEELEQRVPVGK